MKSKITQNQVRELFDYRNGNLYWGVSRQRIKIGNLAGYLQDGYHHIGINGESYRAHRLIFLYHHGYLPVEIDHIDGNKLNNDISNLREVTHQENSKNQKKPKSMNGKPTTSRYKGVTWYKRYKKWRCQIMINGKSKHLGYCDSEINAAKAYDRAAIELFGKFAKLNEV